MSLVLIVRAGRLAICRLAPDAAVPSWADAPGFSSITRTPGELSVTCDESRVPAGVRCERGWRGLEVRGPLAFSEVGILQSIAEPLAREGIGLLAFSTFDTDWILVREEELERASACLVVAGHRVEEGLSQIVVRAMRQEDWEFVRRIHEEGIATGQATFETEPGASWDDWNHAHMGACRLVVDGERGVAGWAALSPVSSRCVYGGVGEVSVYVAEAERGKGIGRALLERLVATSEENGIWTLQAGIFPENLASLRMHRSCGFRDVGRRERLGRLGDVWRDVLLLERRSPNVGL